MKYYFKMNYGKQLQTSAWMRRKYDILQRDNFVCSICLKDNAESQLQVHHITYILDGRKCWNYPDYLLVTLCEECHKKEHINKNIRKPSKIMEWIKKLATPKQKQDQEKQNTTE